MGQMPNKLGSGGIEYSEVVEGTREGLDDLQNSVETLKGDTGALRHLIARVTKQSRDSFAEVYRRLDERDETEKPAK